MFRFGKSGPDKLSKLSTSEADEDLLAASEQAEFEASVRASRERAEPSRSVMPADSPAVPSRDLEIEWCDQTDVYKPQRIDAESYLKGVSIEPRPRLRAGASIALIAKSTDEVIRSHLTSNIKVELGGLLCGEALYDEAREIYVVRVGLALPAIDGECTQTSFTYTGKSWEAMMPGWSGMNPSWTIVGSYHSHPGMGVFLSSVDLTTQADVFPHDWQVAMVMDPVSRECGLFVGVNGKPCPYWIV